MLSRDSRFLSTGRTGLRRKNPTCSKQCTTTQVADESSIRASLFQELHFLKILKRCSIPRKPTNQHQSPLQDTLSANNTAQNSISESKTPESSTGGSFRKLIWRLPYRPQDGELCVAHDGSVFVQSFITPIALLKNEKKNGQEKKKHINGIYNSHGSTAPLGCFRKTQEVK